MLIFAKFDFSNESRNKKAELAAITVIYIRNEEKVAQRFEPEDQSRVSVSG